MIYKTLHRKLKQHKPTKNLGVNSLVQEGQVVPAPLVAPIMLLLNYTNMWYINHVGDQHTYNWSNGFRDVKSMNLYGWTPSDGNSTH